MKKHILNILLVKTLTLSSIDSVAAAAAEGMPDEPIRSGQVSLTMGLDRYEALIVECPGNASLVRGILESDRIYPPINPTVIDNALSGDYESFKLLFDLVGEDMKLSKVVSVLVNEEDAIGRYNAHASATDVSREEAEKVQREEQLAAMQARMRTLLAEEATENFLRREGFQQNDMMRQMEQQARDAELARQMHEAEQAAAADLVRQEAEGLAAARALYEQEQAAGATGAAAGAAAAAAAPMEADPDAVIYDVNGVALKPSMARLIRERLPMWESVFINGVRDAENNRIGTPAAWRNLIAQGGFFDIEVLKYLQSEEFKEFSVGKNMEEVTAHITERFPL